MVSGAATNAAYTVNYSSGSATVPVDQTKNAGGTSWVSLGKFAFTQAGTGQKVTLAENSGGTVVADAVKVVRDTTGVTNTAHHDFGYSYDPNGNLTGITDTSPGTAIDNYVVSNDGLDRLTQVLEQAAGVTQHTTTYGYNPAGNLTSRGHDTATSTYTYDPRNLLATETDATSATDPSPQVSTFTFDPKGLLSHEAKPNGNTVDDTYFADGLPQTQTENTSGGTLVSSHAYTYNPDGNKTQDTEKLMSADNNSSYLSHTLGYTYDPRDRIATVTKDGTTTESYTHDANDNVTSQTLNATATSFNYDRNRLLTAVSGGGVADYNYDPYGRLDTVTARGTVTQRNTYDGFDHLASEYNSTAGTTTYTYDPLNRKTSQTTGGKETDFAYLGLSTDLISESVNGSVTKSYAYTPGGARLSQTTHNADGSTTNGYYSYNDHSDVEAVTGQSGGTTATYGYTAYGQNDIGQFTGADKNNTQPSSTSQPFNAYRFNAMRWDSSSGQYDMGFRNYDSSLNQFLSRDMYNGALSDMQLDSDPFTGNRYTFGGGNPISNIELDGHMFPAGGGGPTGSAPSSSCPIGVLTCNTGIFGGGRGSVGCSPSVPECPGYNGPSGYLGGRTIVVAPTKTALNRAIQAAENAIGGGSGFYFPGEIGYPVTSSNPAVRQAVAQSMCASHPKWCTVIGGNNNSLLGQLGNLLNSIAPLIGGFDDDPIPLGDTAEPVPTSAEVAVGKWDYMFGRVSSNLHNAARSSQLASQLARIGVYDTPAGRALLQSHFDEALSTDENIVNAYSNKYGTFVDRESLLAGPGGFLKILTTWKMTQSGSSLTTVIPFGGP